MSETPSLEGSEELFALLDKLPRRLSGFIYDGAGITFDKHNQAWILQQKVRGRLLKMTVPSEHNDDIKRLKDLMVDVTKADLQHMEDLRKKHRDPRQPIIAEEIDTAAWAIKVPFRVGKSLYLRALQHIKLTAEEEKDAELATKKFLAFYETLLRQDLGRLTPDQQNRRNELLIKADLAAQEAGYEVMSRTSIPFILVRYKCSSAPPTPNPLGFTKTPGVESVLIARSLWNPKKEETSIRRDIALRLNSLY